jgi:hypothetical protein
MGLLRLQPQVDEVGELAVKQGRDRDTARFRLIVMGVPKRDARGGGGGLG